MVRLKQVLAFVLTWGVLLATSPSSEAWASVAIHSPVFAMQEAPQAALSASQIDELVSPIALYPDALVAQILAASTYPDQVAAANTWLQANSGLNDAQRAQQVNGQSWDPSVKALTQFPSVLNNMATNLSWTSALGDAFYNQQADVMASVQRLRAQAKKAGNLKSTPQQTVTTENQGGQQVIVIQPANPQVVYVPVYNPTVVYYPPPPDAAAVLIGFGLGIAIGAAMSNSSYYYSPWGWGAWGMGWHSHTVVVRGGAWVVPPYARYPYVRPIPVPYGGYYRPRPYAYSQTNVNINRVTVNNPGYRGGVTPRPTPYAPVARPATPLPATSSGARPGSNPGTAPGQRPTTLPSAGNGSQPTRPAAGSGGTRPTTQPDR